MLTRKIVEGKYQIKKMYTDDSSTTDGLTHKTPMGLRFFLNYRIGLSYHQTETNKNEGLPTRIIITSPARCYYRRKHS